ncbi:MAG: DsbA family protein [Cytophagaceae bacterium]
MKTLVISLILILSMASFNPDSKPKILYVYDPLCGWCYGFSPVILKAQEKYKDQFDFEVISGGMVVGERIGPIGKVAPYIKWAYKDVEKAAGVKFGENFLTGILEPGTAVFSSITPSVALSVFKAYQPDKSVLFASEIQKAIYFDGIEPENKQSYGKYAEKFGIPPAEFVAALSDRTFLKTASEEFKLSSKLGVKGFPTVFILKDGKYYQLTNGFVGFEQFDKAIQKFLK